MRSGSADLIDALTGAFSLEFECDLYYGDERKVTNLPITAPDLRWDGSADIEGSGSCTVLWTDEAGASLKPNEATDWLSPFGARIVLYASVTAGAFSERKQLGVYTVTEIPTADDHSFTWNGFRLAVGSTVELQFSDRMVEVQRDRFTRLSSPSQLLSVYAELAELTGFQLTRTVADGPISRAVVYQEDRIKAVQDIAAILDSVPFMESDGTLSLRFTTPGLVVASLTVGEAGTITRVGSVLDSAGVYNGIIIRGETDGQAAVLAERWITEGPLAASLSGGARTPYHRVPKFYSSPFITTQAQAEAAIDGLLAQLSTPRASQLDVTCIVNPLLQVGDVVTVDDSEAVWTIRLMNVALSGRAYMDVSGDVLARVPYAQAFVEIVEAFGFGDGGFGDGGFGF